MYVARLQPRDTPLSKLNRGFLRSSTRVSGIEVTDFMLIGLPNLGYRSKKSGPLDPLEHALRGLETRGGLSANASDETLERTLFGLVTRGGLIIRACLSYISDEMLERMLLGLVTRDGLVMRACLSYTSDETLGRGLSGLLTRAFLSAKASDDMLDRRLRGLFGLVGVCLSLNTSDDVLERGLFGLPNLGYRSMKSDPAVDTGEGSRGMVSLRFIRLFVLGPGLGPFGRALGGLASLGRCCSNSSGGGLRRLVTYGPDCV